MSKSQEQSDMIRDLKREIEEVKYRIDSILNERNLQDNDITDSGQKIMEAILKEYEAVRSMMNKALSIYEETREIKEKLLEDRLIFRRMIEGQKKRHEEVVQAIEMEARMKVANELEKIEEFYRSREEQIKQLVKLKEIAERRLQQRLDRDAGENRAVEGDMKGDYKGGQEQNGISTKHAGILKKAETEKLVTELQENKEAIRDLRSDDPDTSQDSAEVDIERINKALRQEYVDESESTLSGRKHSQDTEPFKRDIGQWQKEQHDQEYSEERLRKLRQSRERMRRIYEQAMRNKTISRIHDKALMTEIGLALDKKEKDDD